ncbi:winged helix-turn-helix domain-containing protein [Haloterrigena sp. SYSU A558-1]|uniref:Winged helix-turn-helix domain-containing protein n=1 Tax=Haloterrigena gelatinilytica TaxID=2741724 RepID=A0ABX2LFD5_9EURY|nr:winged helix-turn-helix domain-containing protein [Haloterrigena gelatinilytica]NUC74967.1 winged helix-turn-helix domain-containing protein [Haloterrigena gelatinilytica]
MSGEFDVLVCKPCSGTWIKPVDDWSDGGDYKSQDSVDCPHCGAERDPSTVKRLKSLPSREQAGEFRARYLAKRSEEVQTYNEFVNEWGVYGEQLNEVDARTPSPTDDCPDVEIGTVGEYLEAHYATAGDTSERVTNPIEETIVGHKKRFETLNEYRLEQFREETRKYGELAEEMAGTAVSLDDQLETYYGEADGDHRTLNDPEPSTKPDAPDYDIQSLAIQPTPPAQQRLETVTADVPPTVSEWLPAVLEDILPKLVRAVDELADEHADGEITAGRLAKLLVTECGVPDERTGFASVLATYARQYHGVDLDDQDLLDYPRDQHERNKEWAQTALTSIGTGRNALGLTYEDLAATIVPILRETTVEPEFVVRFPGEDWEASGHASTRRKTLTALEQLAMAGDVTIVASPRVARTVDSSHPEFADRVTQTAMPGRQNIQSDEPANECDEGTIYTDLELMDKRAGKLAILKHLERDPDATVKDLANDADIGLSRGSIRPYIEALADDHGYVDVDRRGNENTMSLSKRGDVAAGLITNDLRVVHPDQESVFATFDHPDNSDSDDCSDSVTETPSQSASTVYGTADGMGGGEAGRTAEGALADTGDAETAGYVQWLPKVAGSSWPLHARITAADARDGVNLNDYPVERWEDGRVTYVSCMEDHLAVSTQYGGTIPTLVRLATALLDDQLWSTVLTPSALGDELEHCFGDAVESSREACDHLVRAAQVGWLSEDERAYDLLKDRYAGVRSVLLGKLGELDDLDEDERTETIQKAHGLLMSATALYDAIGVDISIEVRVPEPNNLNDTQFCRFVSEVATRQSSYGMHSLQRNFWEPDSQKRKTAMGFDPDPSDPNAHLRASWVVSGPGISDYAEQIRGAIAARDEQRLDDRTDYRPVELEVPVTATSDYAAMRHAVTTVLEKKNLCPGRESDAMRRTARLFEAYTGSPFDVVDALTALTRSQRPGDVTIADIEHALSTLPAGRLFPTLDAPTPGKILKAVLTADGPIGRADILERVGCSGETYRKHAHRLEALDILERVNGGEWSATVAPWYVPETDATKPGTDRVSVTTTGVDGVLFDALDDLGYDLGDPDLIDAFGEVLKRGKLIAAVGAWIDDWVDVLASLLKPNPGAVGHSSHDVVTLGEKPDQTTLGEVAQPALAD